MPDVLLFGATGYTGRLTAAALANRNVDFVVAGRDRSKLEALAATTGAEVRVASVGDVRGLTGALEDVKVMITCVGPFIELGDTAAEAAIASHTHYIDSTGEGVFIQRLIDRYGQAARDAGIAMAPAMGFDEVPADVAATVAAEGLQRPALDLTYALPSNGSRGTISTIMRLAGAPGPWIENGDRRDITAGQETRWSPMPPPLGPKLASSFPLAELRLAPLHLEVESFRTYVTTDPIRRLGLKAALPILRAATSTAAGREGLDRLLSRLPDGPTDEQRMKGRWTILAEARSGARWRNVTITGTDVYGLTAEFLAAGAVKMASDGYEQTGVVSPVQAVGLETWLKEFAAHDVNIETYEPRKGD